MNVKIINKPKMPAFAAFPVLKFQPETRVFVLRTTARQPLLYAALQAKAGASDWSRTSDLGLMSPTL